jgi:malonate decarboxylase alpha subunit
LHGERNTFQIVVEPQARKADRLVAASPFADGRILAPETIVQALEILIRPGDRVAIEGNN